ncbi:MAG TPA: cyclic nucleotide-binding domain-containing protein [Anaeromyxobacteraceae bacterium]|nr:cyclic nucleotide-binding domain-containing protein [Anaeromyxobacteraceae bacterium]
MAPAPREVWGDLAATAFVEASVLFRSLDPEARRDILQLARSEGYAAGEPIADPAQEERLLLVREGSASVLLPRDGGEVEAAVLERGAFFGEERVLGEPLAARLVARSDVELVAFPAPVVAALSERFPRVKKLLEAVAAARRKDAAQRLGG